MIFRRFLAFFLSFSLIFSSTSALAASPAGWTASAADTVMAGATATITAIKGSGSSAMKAVISHRPTAVAVGKELVKGGGVLALAYAMSKLLDAGVDWVLDPENNRVKYKDEADAGAGGGTGTGKYLYAPYHVQGDKYGTADAACTIGYKKFYESIGKTSVVAVYIPENQCKITHSDGSAQQQIVPSVNPNAGAGGGTGTDEYKYIPISTVAAEVLAGAEAGHAESQDFVKAVAVGQANAGDLDTALDAAAEPTTDTADPDAPPTDPTKPFDDSGILAALKKILSALGLLSLLGTISDSLTAMMDWFKGAPEEESTEVDIVVPDIAPANTDINFGGQCPAPFVYNGSIFGNSISIQLLDTPMLCSFLATYVKWPVYAASTLYALYLIGGRRGE